MYNRNALYANNLGEDLERAVPNGQICSAGRAETGRYGPMDNPGPWPMTRFASTFTVHVQDVARHGADYLKGYITKQDLDPATSTISWNNLDLIEQTGQHPSQLGYKTEATTSVRCVGRHGRGRVTAMAATIEVSAVRGRGRYFSVGGPRACRGRRAGCCGGEAWSPLIPMVWCVSSYRARSSSASPR